MSLVRDLFTVIRFPNVLLIFIAQISFFVKYNSDQTIPIAIVILVCSIPALVACIGYIENNWQDKLLDTNCKGKSPNIFIENNSYYRLIRYCLRSFILILFGILMLFFFNSKETYSSYIPLIGVYIICEIIMYYYNIFLKKTVLIGNFSIAILCSISLIYPFLVFQKDILPQLFFLLCSIFVLTLIREIIKDIEDAECDKKYNYTTAPILYGISITKKIVYSLLAIYSIIVIFVAITSRMYSQLWLLPLLLITIIALNKNNIKGASLLVKCSFVIGIVVNIVLEN